MPPKRWDLNPATQDRQQVFEALLLPLGRSAHTARPEDFRRVRVVARDELNARNSPEVLALVVQGHHVCEVVLGGAEADTVTRARIAASAVDEVPSDLRGANTAKPSGVPVFAMPRLG